MSDSSQTDAVIKGITAMIISGELRAGDRLPVEKDLAEALSVSRTPLREGVRALVLMGVLETRQGAGTYVTSLEASLIADPLGLLIDLQSLTNAAHLHAVRRLLEAEAAAQAAMHISESDLLEAQRLLEETEPVVVRGDAADLNAIMEADLAFHRITARASGNTILAALIEALAGRTIESRMWRAVRETRAITTGFYEHKAILNEIVNREPDRARVQMSHHLLALEEFIHRNSPDHHDPVEGGAHGGSPSL